MLITYVLPIVNGYSGEQTMNFLFFSNNLGIHIRLVIFHYPIYSLVLFSSISLQKSLCLAATFSFIMLPDLVFRAAFDKAFVRDYSVCSLPLSFLSSFSSPFSYTLF